MMIRIFILDFCFYLWRSCSRSRILSVQLASLLWLEGGVRMESACFAASHWSAPVCGGSGTAGQRSARPLFSLSPRPRRYLDWPVVGRTWVSWRTGAGVLWSCSATGTRCRGTPGADSLSRSWLELIVQGTLWKLIQVSAFSTGCDNPLLIPGERSKNNVKTSGPQIKGEMNMKLKTSHLNVKPEKLPLYFETKTCKNSTMYC